ncbi:unnamed protein product, partial [Amoebophrya sp. A120]
GGTNVGRGKWEVCTWLAVATPLGIAAGYVPLLFTNCVLSLRSRLRKYGVIRQMVISALTTTLLGTFCYEVSRALLVEKELCPKQNLCVDAASSGATASASRALLAEDEQISTVGTTSSTTAGELGAGFSSASSSRSSLSTIIVPGNTDTTPASGGLSAFFSSTIGTMSSSFSSSTFERRTQQSIIEDTARQRIGGIAAAGGDDAKISASTNVFPPETSAGAAPAPRRQLASFVPSCGWDGVWGAGGRTMEEILKPRPRLDN